MASLHPQALAIRQKYHRESEGLARHLASIYVNNPALVDEVLSGLDHATAAEVRERFDAALPFASRLSHGAGFTKFVWPTTTHKNIVVEAFDKLDKKAQGSIAHGSRITDWESLNVKTLKEENAPQHAMTPASKVRELGSLEKAQESARGEAKKFVSGKLTNAKDYYSRAKEGPKAGYDHWMEMALKHFGEAMHPIMDNWSPAHHDFQVYDGNETVKAGVIGAAAGSILGPVGTLGGAAAGVIIGSRQHSKIEERSPTDDEMNSMVDEMRLAYQETFGITPYTQAVSEAKRNETASRLAKRGSKGMLIK